ncbi:hypothetical protein [Erythrobacter phage vB_EliS-L02]|nr:hypothetical protein [Erythrobacter phage vB_EliS-L02]
MRFTDRPEIDRHLIAAGVRNLKEFGYDSVNVDNITSDMVFAKFFSRMLEDNEGQRDDVDEAIVRLMEEIDANLEEAGG